MYGMQAAVCAKADPTQRRNNGVCRTRFAACTGARIGVCLFAAVVLHSRTAAVERTAAVGRFAAGGHKHCTDAQTESV